MSRILIICRAFAPDSVVGAKRMAMLAKYLKCTNEVIVIRSGLIFGKPDTDSMLNESETLRIISYEGDNSPANKFEKGEWITDNSVSVKKRISLLRKGKVYTLLKRVYRFFIYYKDNYHVYKNAKKVASKICEDNSIDVVITTYSPLGTTACGYYLKKKYGLKWIMDLRDLMDNVGRTPIMRRINRRFQYIYARSADVITTPTHGFLEEVLTKTRTSAKGYVIYNGYEDECYYNKSSNDSGILRFCYTGTIHDDKCTFVPLLYALNELINEGVVDRKRIIIEYAGKNSDRFLELMNSVPFDIPFKDNGYLTKSETLLLQSKSDLFLIMVMNLKDYTGVLTGKLCESIQNKLPVVGLVSGNIPNSELKLTINKYQLGICYEEADDSSYSRLKDYISEQYKMKINMGKVLFNPSNECYNDFNYRKIVERLNEIIDNL